MLTTTRKSSRSRVLLADGHQIILDTESQLLTPEFDIVGTARDGAALLRAADQLNPDVIVLDITMPNLNGLEVARQLKARDSRAKIVFVSVHADLDLVREALSIGASGYVVKNTMASDLLRAVRSVLEGEQFVSSSCSK
jgi:DNA-binding NarL/FixJ family response regulator